jgi:hypothetical protein
MSNIKKKSYEASAKLKTFSDYVLILVHCNGYSLDEARKFAVESEGEPLFEELLRRNTELFKTGDIVIS